MILQLHFSLLVDIRDYVANDFKKLNYATVVPVIIHLPCGFFHWDRCQIVTESVEPQKLCWAFNFNIVVNLQAYMFGWLSMQLCCPLQGKLKVISMQLQGKLN